MSTGRDGSEGIFCYREDGRSQSGDRNADLVNVPVETSKWQNVYIEAGSVALFNDPRTAELGRDYFRKIVGILEHKYADGEFVTAVFHPSK
jgi:hypothetical protein